MKNLLLNSFFAFAIACALGSCKQGPDSINSGLHPMSVNASTTANPALTYVSSTSGHTSYPTIAVMDTDGGHSANVYTAGSTTATEQFAAWSPSGGSVSFVENKSIKAVDVSVVNGAATGSNARTITTDTKTVVGQAWCSQSTTKKIAYIDQAAVNNSYEQGYIYTIPDGGGTATLLYSSTAGTSHTLRSPTWSSDDKYIAFLDRKQLNTNQSHGTILRIINAVTGAQVDTADLTSLFQASNCEWARSGNDIAFNDVDTNSGGHNHIYYYTAFSGNAATTQSTLGQMPTWSPNDANIMMGKDGAFNVVQKIQAKGTTITAVTSGKNQVKWKR